MAYHYAHNAVSRYEKFKHIMRHILKKEYDKNLAEQWAERFSALTRERIIHCPYVEGAKEFLDFFSGKSPLYIASATPIDELKIILGERGILRYFKGIYGAPKRKPEIFQDVMKIENVLPEDILFIGDSNEDYEAAESSHVHFIARVSTIELNDRIKNKFNNLHEIYQFLRPLQYEQ